MLYITNNERKQTLLKTQTKLTNRKIYTLNEIKQIYPYIWDEKTLDYIITNYNVILEIAKIYLNQIISYPIEEIKDEKGKFLQSLKQDLIQNNLLTENKMIIKYFQKQEILIDLPETKELKRYFSKLENVSFLKPENKEYIPTIYKGKNIETEIAFVGEQIANLIKKNISPDNIYISNLDETYSYSLLRTFKLLGIPVELKEKQTIKETYLGTLFLKNYIDDPISSLNIIKDEIKNNEDQEIYNKIVSTINKYIDLKNKKIFITYDLSISSINKKTTNCIHEINWLEKEFNENDYVFILNANARSIPKTYKDEDYLKDSIKESLNIETSKERNILEKEQTIQKIKSIPNCIITFKEYIQAEKYYPSPILEEWQTKEIETLNFNISHLFNELYLAESLDEYRKYNTSTKELELLNNSYDIPYLNYKNEYTQIPKHQNEIKLSYTSLDTYIKCPFKYYLTYILKITPYEETFSMYIGTLFHKILEETLKNNNNWEELYDKEINEKEFTTKEKFFLKLLKKDLSSIIEVIQNQMEYTSLEKIETEKEIQVEINDNIHISFTGFIDKILSKEYNGQTIKVIIDYKTGSQKTNESYIPLGFHLQLPIYLYLTKQEKNTLIGGIYYQNIVPNRINQDEKYTYEQLQRKALKWNGYSTNNTEILEMIDSSYKDSHIINSLKVKNDGDFYNYSKVLDETDTENLTKIVEEKIKTNAQKISNFEFPITSKIIDNKENISCNYCKFKDICFHTPKDNIYLESDKTFLKKEGA